MKYAIILQEGKTKRALLKTDNDERTEMLSILCQRHMKKLYPKATWEISADRTLNTMVEMHTDREWIIDRLRAYELPLPYEVIIEGDYRHEEY